MRVGVYYKNSDVRVEERPKPVVGDGELLLKTMASGICGSDVMEWYRIKTAPRILGHEVTGEIVEVGRGVRKYRKGDRVFVSHHVPCNKCDYCRRGHHTSCETLRKTNFDPGGFSEYIRVPKINVENGVYPLPKGMSYEDGTLIEPLACVLRGQRLMGVGKGDRVLVLGSGISGLMHIMLGRLQGAKRIVATDVSGYRLKMAEKFGADEALDARGFKPEEHPSDKVIVCTGAQSAAVQALKSVDRGGKIMYFAVPAPGYSLPVPINEFWRNEITLMTSYGAGPGDLEESLKLIAKKKVNVHGMITHRLTLDEIGIGFRLVAEADKSMKVVIKL
ncbi:MAG: alcohol dehydrogenase catalytic domain-containing protein [Candidatus Altiarchaeota archaeon]